LKMSERSGLQAGVASALAGIGEIYAAQGDFEKALEHYGRSLEIDQATGDKMRIAGVLSRIAEAWSKRGSPSSALEFAERAGKMAEELGQIDLLWQARLAAGNAYRDLGRRKMARRSFEDSIASVETLRSQISGGEQDQQRFFESRAAPYHAMVELLLAEGRTAEALIYSERAKSRVLLDVLVGGRVDITKSMTYQEQEQERRLRARLVSLNSQIQYENSLSDPDHKRVAGLRADLEKTRHDFEEFQTRLYATHPSLKTQRGDVSPLNIDEVTALLPDDATALLEFVVSEERAHLFVLTKGRSGSPSRSRIGAFTLNVNDKDLAAKIEHLRQMLAGADNRFGASARELYNLLLKPAAEEISGKTRLVVVPSGPLWELPIQALMTPGGRYIIEDHTVSYVPSLTVLREMTRARARRARPSGARTLLAMGNPALGKETVARVNAVFMDEKFEPLPDAERQVGSLAKIYGAERVRAYVGAEAREERFKSEAGNYGILHLATHGILNDRSPMYSHLLLAQTGETGKEDGLLEAWELMNLDLKADLAVLSACETARGRVGKGEGMIGLTWALFVAGVPTTVVSQWKVRSDSTAELMVEFHRRLRSQNANSRSISGVASALREAALKVKRDSRYRHPFHWASFIVVGDGQ
jgi:CHAT domain-containing protein